MASTYTTNLTLEKPGIGEQDGDWGATLNSNFDTIDTAVDAKASKTGSETLTNKTIDVDNNTVSNIEVDNLKSGVLDTDLSSVSGSDDTLASAKSIKSYVDTQIATEDTLTELNDTSISSPAAGHLIIYDNTASHWENATLTAGSNVSITNGDGAITIASTDTNTQLSQEQVEDYVGGMLDGDETFISVSYDDTDGNIDFTVPVKDEDAMGSDSATHLATQQSIKAYVDGKVGTVPADDISTGDAAVTLATSAGNITIDAQGNDTDIILKGTDGSADTTFLTIDGSAAGEATFNAGIVIADAGNIGSASDKDAIAIASTGIVTFAEQPSLPYAVKNYIYNGDTSLCQRATSVSGVGNGDAGYHVQDRWQFYETGAPNAVVTQTRTTDVPNGFQYSMQFDCTTASGTVASGDLIYLAQIFEGQDLYAWKKGTADALPVTLSFWVKSTKTGTYICRLLDSDNSRHIAKSYTVSSSNTWEYKTITFAGDTTGIFARDAASSLYVQWGLVAGSDFTSGTLATSWASSSSANMFVGQVDALDNTSNNYLITGVQLQLGNTATAFQHETYAENFIRCARYYEARTGGTLYGYNMNGGGYDYSNWQFKVRKRGTPTCTGHTGTQQQINQDNAGVYNSGAYPQWSSSATADAEIT